MSITCINYSNTTKNNILLIDVSTSRRKPSSGLMKLFTELRKEYGQSTVMDKLLHNDDRHRKSVLMKASDVKPKRR